MDKRPAFSDLDLSRWKEYDDVLTGAFWLLGTRDKTGPHAGDYWGNFVPRLIGDMQMSFGAIAAPASSSYGPGL